MAEDLLSPQGQRLDNNGPDVPNSVAVADLNGDGDPEGAAGKAYTIAAVVDTHHDDLAACGPGDLLTLTCFNALADDDTDPFDDRVVRSAPRVQAP